MHAPPSPGRCQEQAGRRLGRGLGLPGRGQAGRRWKWVRVGPRPASGKAVLWESTGRAPAGGGGGGLRSRRFGATTRCDAFRCRDQGPGRACLRSHPLRFCSGSAPGLFLVCARRLTTYRWSQPRLRSRAQRGMDAGAVGSQPGRGLGGCGRARLMGSCLPQSVGLSLCFGGDRGRTHSPERPLLAGRMGKGDFPPAFFPFEAKRPRARSTSLVESRCQGSRSGGRCRGLPPTPNLIPALSEAVCAPSVCTDWPARGREQGVASTGIG